MSIYTEEDFLLHPPFPDEQPTPSKLYSSSNENIHVKEQFETLEIQEILNPYFPTIPVLPRTSEYYYFEDIDSMH